MADIFSGLKGFGINPDDDTQLYKKEEKPIPKKKNSVSEKSHENIIYETKIECPVCESEITFKAIKTGHLKLERTDTDLRPIYNLLDPSIYDVIVCNSCGYAALRKAFSSINVNMKNLLKEKVTCQFKSKDYPEFYDYSVAIERYKLALYDATVMETKNGEKAYLCLKIAWLYRGYFESLEDSNQEEEKLKALKQEEINFMKYAVKGFKLAYERETFPVMGLSEITVSFLIGELLRRLGEYEDAIYWIGQVLISKDAGRRLKDRARYTKEMIYKQKHKNDNTKQE